MFYPWYFVFSWSAASYCEQLLLCPLQIFSVNDESIVSEQTSTLSACHELRIALHFLKY